MKNTILALAAVLLLVGCDTEGGSKKKGKSDHYEVPNLQGQKTPNLEPVLAPNIEPVLEPSLKPMNEPNLEPVLAPHIVPVLVPSLVEGDIVYVNTTVITRVFVNDSLVKTTTNTMVNPGVKIK